MISRRAGVWLLISFTAAVCVAAALFPRTPQPLAYHDFADKRAWLGIPNFGDVVSNLAFAIAGVWGMIWLCSRTGKASFVEELERWAYFAVFLGLLLTAFGSSYYHLAPDNERLVWDRLPMTLAFMGLVSAMIAERIGVRCGVALLPVLLVVGAASVVWWWHTESVGAGDLRFYAAVQVYAVLVLPIFLLLLPRYTRGGDFLVVFAFYVVAKVFESGDRLIFSLTQRAISGHTLKHLAAGAAGLCILRMLQKRKAIGLNLAGPGKMPGPFGAQGELKPGATRNYFLETMRPETIVAAGPPLNVRASKGELRDLLGDCFTS